MTERPSTDAILRAVGAGLHNWSLVEIELATLFGHLIELPHSPKAHAAFDAVVSFDARLAMCDRLVPMDAVDELDAEIWAKLSARLSKFYKKRHELAHFSVSRNDPGDPTIRPFLTLDSFRRGDTRHLTESQVRERSAKFVELRLTINWFGKYFILRRIGQQEARIAGLEEPPLASRLRELAARSLAERRARGQNPQD